MNIQELKDEAIKDMVKVLFDTGLNFHQYEKGNILSLLAETIDKINKAHEEELESVRAVNLPVMLSKKQIHEGIRKAKIDMLKRLLETPISRDLIHICIKELEAE